MLSTKRSGSKTTGLIGMLFLCVCAALLAFIFRGPEIPAIAETSSNSGDLIQLAPGSSSRGELTAGAKNVFTVSVDHDQLLRFSVDKGDLLVTTSLYGPTNAKLLEHVSQDFESVELSFPAQVAGKYTIELQSQEKSATPRAYEIKLHPLTSVTPLNRKDSEARQTMAHAEALRLEWKEASFRQAAEYYDQAALTWSSMSDLANAAYAALKAGDVYFHLGAFQEASKRYQNAEAFAAKADDWLGRARALSHLGRLLVHVGNNDGAQEQLTKAQHLLTQHESNKTATAANAWAELFSNLAEVSYSKGDFITAEKQLESALSVFQNNRKGEAKVRLFQGYIYGSKGRTEKAFAELRRAIDLYGAVNDKVGEALALTTLTLRFVDKKDPSAITTFRKTMEVFRAAGDRHSQAIVLNALGESHYNLKQYAIATEGFKSAFQLFEDIGAMDGASVAAFQ
jgi:tetratricopeptide (TPR) repeat protein